MLHYVPAHKGTKVDGEHTIDYVVTRWMVFNELLSQEDVYDAMAEHGYSEYSGGAGQVCSSLVWWRSTSRTLIIERSYLDV